MCALHDIIGLAAISVGVYEDVVACMIGCTGVRTRTHAGKRACTHARVTCPEKSSTNKSVDAEGRTGEFPGCRVPWP